MPLLSRSHQQKYAQLLAVLTANFLLSPLLQGPIGGALSSLILLYAILLIVKTLPLRKRLFFAYLSIACIAFGLEIVSRFTLDPEIGAAKTLSLCVQVTYALYLGLSVWWMMVELSLTSKVTLDTVRGGVSIYLLIGFFWALLYSIVQTLDANAFSENLQLRFNKIVYFSFTTLTTLGYGDVLPVNEFALVLANVEAIIGQLYPAVFISILVGGYLSQRSD